MIPMLAAPTRRHFPDHTPDQIRDVVCAGARYAVEPKIDGLRLLAHGGAPLRMIGRNGQRLTKAIPGPIRAALTELPFLGAWVLDGELVDDTYWVWDVPYLDGVLGPESPWSVRRQALEILTAGWARPDGPVRLVPAAQSDDRGEFWDRVLAAGGEGLILKPLDSRYIEGEAGRRSWVKVKTTSTLDCVVTALRINGKENMGLGLYVPGKRMPVRVGECSRLTGDGPLVMEGDVVEVTVLDVSDANRLIQPVMPRRRRDKKRRECTIDQLDDCRKNPRAIEEVVHAS